MYINKISNYNFYQINMKKSKISSSNFTYTNPSVSFSSKISQVNQDVFEEFRRFEKSPISPIVIPSHKTVLTNNVFKAFPCCNNVHINSFNEYATLLYNETFEIVKKQNPLFEELDIPKPKLRLVPSFENDSTYGAYEFFSNTIEFKETNLKNDYYVCYELNNSGERIPINICSEDEIGKYKVSNTDFTDTYTEKLTEQEKKLWVESIFAHELRHCLQSHICASVGKSHKFLVKLASDNIQKRKKLAKILKQGLDSNIIPSNEYNKTKAKYLQTLEDIKRAEKEYSYAFNFKPHKILANNTKLKFSIFPEDNKYWSVKNHLIKDLKYNNKNDNDKIYFDSPREIDAFHYEEEFILSQQDNNKYRENCILGMLVSIIGRYMEGLTNLKKNGYQDLIEKS